MSAESNRLVRLCRLADDDERTYGLSWYHDAHRWCAEVAERHGLTTRQVAGIVAALSPRTEWTLNQRSAVQLITTGDTFGLKLGRGRAQRILAGEDPADVLGGPKVQAFFDNLADPDRSTAVVIDRHAVDAYLGRTTDDRTRKFTIERKGGYDRVADAYRQASARLGVPPHVVQALVWVVWRNRFAVGIGNGRRAA